MGDAGRFRRALVALPLTLVAAAALGGGSALSVDAAGVGPDTGGCANLATWSFSAPLTTGSTGGTVNEVYSLPYGSSNPACWGAGAGAYYNLGNSIPPVPVNEGVYAQQQNWGPYSETDNFGGTCALATVYNNFWGVSEVGYLVGGVVYVGFPYTQNFGTSNYAYGQLDVFSTFNPCFEQFITGAGAEPRAGESLYAP